MSAAITSQGVVVVVEQGSEWPSWIKPLYSGEGEAHVIAQDEDEAPASFARRVLEDCERLRGEQVELAVIACNERCDDGALLTRRRVARALSRVVADRRNKILFSAARRQSGRGRRALCDLASDLEQELSHHGPAVSVRFGSEHARPAKHVS
jgi:hypothetical protein